LAELHPDLEAALQRLRAVFGFVEILRIVGHKADQNQDDNEADEAEGRHRRSRWRPGRSAPERRHDLAGGNSDQGPLPDGLSVVV
jgi:hypothetical protein